ncbi:VOC family protein [Nocardia sp. NPDC050175]|uniref:VOC family protein n=1 Tax=Nocardia sp. NPDC050175 TaxID=3364317 RepID=UPI0037AC153E
MSKLMPCMGVADTTATTAFYRDLGFVVIDISGDGQDIHLVKHEGDDCAIIYDGNNLTQWLPELTDSPVGFFGMFYLAVDDFDAMHERVAANATIVKDTVVDHNGVKEFYFRDPNGYLIGINDRASLDKVTGDVEPPA